MDECEEIIKNGLENGVEKSVDAEVIDPHCLAENPIQIQFQNISAAAFMIKNGIEYTPCTVNKQNRIFKKMNCYDLSEFSYQKSRSTYNGMDLYLKKDLLQFTGRYGSWFFFYKSIKCILTKLTDKSGFVVIG